MPHTFTIPIFARTQSLDNSRILVIPDLHIPFQHIDAFDFLDKINHLLKPDLVVSLGDELDLNSFSFHEKDSDLFSPGHELQRAIAQISYLHEIFPKLSLMESNHGSLVYRRAKAGGLPRHVLKSYADVLQVGEGWTWHDRLIVKMSNGEDCLFVHSLGANVLQVSQLHGMNVVQGHSHSLFELRYWQSTSGLRFACTAGCLIDDKSMAFAYNKLQPKRPILGAVFIENGIPSLVPMLLDNDGRWKGTRIKK